MEIDKFRRIMNGIAKTMDPLIEQKLLHLITNEEGDKVIAKSLFKFADFYQFAPFIVKKDKNFSKELNSILGSQIKDIP